MTHNIDQAAPTPKQFEVLEGTTPTYVAVIQDEDDAPIDVADISAIILTYFTTKDETIINGRDEQDVLNANDVAIDSSGNLEWVLQANDTAIIDTVDVENNKETHRAIFEWTYDVGNGPRMGKHIVDFIVVNIAQVP